MSFYSEDLKSIPATDGQNVPTMTVQEAEDFLTAVDAGPRAGEILTEDEPEVVKPKGPTVEEMRLAIKDPTTPEIVKRHLKSIVYGEGGNGRKGKQQDMLRRRMDKFVSVQNPDDPKTGEKGERIPYVKEKFRRPPGMSGRQFRNARKLIRQGQKVVNKAGRP